LAQFEEEGIRERHDKETWAKIEKMYGQILS
jgi:hypothetical protein